MKVNLSWMKPSKKEIKKTIEEIHNSFEIASDLALKEANEILSKPFGGDEDKAKRMLSLGFSSAKGVEKYQENEKQRGIKKYEALVINLWAMRYPQYKFILERQVEEICKKYNLVCGESTLYKGDIPMKNVLEIEAFKIKEEHKTLIRTERTFFPFSIKTKRYTEKPLNRGDFKTFDDYWAEMQIKGVYNEAGFQICAPISDMNTEGMKLEGYKLIREIPDPIVLYPVPDGYLVVSKWGLEGDDESLVNEKMN